jgi:hypothetical protein
MDRLGLYKNAQSCMIREGHPKTVSGHRQAAVVRAAGHTTQEKAKIQVAELTHGSTAVNAPPLPLLPTHPIIQSCSLLRHRPPCHLNMPTLRRTLPSTDAN